MADPVIILEANIYDSDDILNWRNDQTTKAMSVSSEEISFDEHNRWFSSCLANPLETLFIGFLFDNKIGICRFSFDLEIKTSEVSINLNPLMRGKNLSYPLLYNSIKKYQEKNKFPLEAKIKKTNKPSIKIFERCGFKIVDDINDLYFLNLNTNL